MSGFEVEIEQLRRAGAAARSAGDQLAALDVSCGIGGGYGALPGARCGERFQALEDSWARAGRDFAGSLTDHATDLLGAAADYNADDTKAAENFPQVRVGGRRETL